MVEGSFDYKLGRARQQQKKEDYWGPMGDFLNFVKKASSYKVLLHHIMGEINMIFLLKIINLYLTKQVSL